LRLHAAYLAEGKNHAGIILANQQRYSLGEQMRRLLKIIAAKSAEEMQNNVEFISYWG
jgi:Tfp pilus assembly protein PilZ